jgi:serine/threonine-protein kinase RsbW
MQTKTFSGRLENISRICEFAVAAAADAGLDSNAAYAVELAVDEACTNIIEHAYGGEGRGDIIITCEASPTGLTVILQDYGKPFNPDKIPVPNPKASLSKVQPRGAGLFLIRKMMDEVHFEFSKEKGNRLTMVKRKSS